MRVSYAGHACHTWSRGRCPAPRNSHSTLGTHYWVRFTGRLLAGPLVDGGTRKRTHQAADHVTQHTPRTLFRLGNCHCTCCLVRPTARLASRSAIRMHFLADAACRIASNAGAKSDLGLCERTLDGVLTRRKRNSTGRNSTRRNATHTNATHKLYARNTVSNGGASDQTMRNAGTAIEGVRWQRETREQDTAWSHNSTGYAAYNLHSPLPLNPRRCSICVPATGPISLRNLLLAGRIKGEKEARGNFHNLTDTQKTHVRITESPCSQHAANRV